MPLFAEAGAASARDEAAKPTHRKAASRAVETCMTFSKREGMPVGPYR